jgi:hypothetical protein
MLLWGAVILFSALQFIALWRVLSEWYRIWIRGLFTSRKAYRHWCSVAEASGSRTQNTDEESVSYGN